LVISYRAEEVNSTHDFLNLQQEWNKLVLEDPSSTIFQTWEWNFNIWKYEGGRSRSLSIILVRDNKGDLVGIAPFYSYKRIILGFKMRIIEFIGSGLTDYRSFIAKTHDNIRIYTEILNWLNKNSGQWDIVELHYISEESPIAKNYDTLFKDFKFRASIQQHNICPYIPLSSNRDFYENLYNQSLVKYLKRKTRKFDRDLNHRILTISDLSDLEGSLENLFDLHKKRRNHQLQLGQFRSEDSKQLFRNLSYDLFKRGWLKVVFLLVDDQKVACLYNFEFKNRAYFYQSGLDPNPKFAKYSLGYIILAFTIKEALESGIKEYDFLSGNEDYKKEWTRVYRSLYRIRITSSRSKKIFFFMINEKLVDFFYGSRFYKSKLIRKLYFTFKKLGKNYKEEMAVRTE
jgi:CelD/BcsL family acetyltransferase involved in cellulose biosynthesis